MCAIKKEIKRVEQYTGLLTYYYKIDISDFKVWCSWFIGSCTFCMKEFYTLFSIEALNIFVSYAFWM